MINSFLVFFTVIFQTSLVCLREEGEKATINALSACTCSDHEIIAELEENGEGIQEIIYALGAPSGGGGDDFGKEVINISNGIIPV